MDKQFQILAKNKSIFSLNSLLPKFSFVHHLTGTLLHDKKIHNHNKILPFKENVHIMEYIGNIIIGIDKLPI
jgi:hypothetical protein